MRDTGYPARSSVPHHGACMSGMGVPHLVRAGASQLVGGRRMVGCDDISGLTKEAPHHVPLAGAGNARCAVVEAREQWRLRIPARRRDRQAALREIQIERRRPY